MNDAKWVYEQTEPCLFTVGHFDPQDKWHTDSDYNTREEAANRCAFLNSGVKSFYRNIAHDLQQALAERNELRQCCCEMLDMIERLPEMGKLSPCDGRVRWRKALGLDPQTGKKPHNIESERRFYAKQFEMCGTEMTGAHILLVPAGMDIDGKHWQALHGESMHTIGDFELDDGETVEDLAKLLRQCLPGAEVQPPMEVGG